MGRSILLWLALAVLLRWLRETRPDVACLQELNAPPGKFPEAALRDAGYGSIWNGQKSWNGVAIQARGEKQKKRGGACRASRRTSTAAILKRRSTASSVPLPSQWQSGTLAEVRDYKLRWFERLTSTRSTAQLDAPVVLAGDYNVMPTVLGLLP